MRIIVIILSSFMFISCSKELDTMGSLNKESVNGIEINWRDGVTSEQRKIVMAIIGNMVRVKGGRFVMGATPEQVEYARANEYPLCYVELSDYYICKFEITDEQYIAIASDPREGTAVTSLYLSWEDWQYFIEAFNEISGLKMDFPTEAQWEFAARGGLETKGYIFPGSNNLLDVWTDSEVKGSKTPNELGLYNMADLKSEWCKDRYYEYNDAKLLRNPCIDEGKQRVVRGGNDHCEGTNSKYLSSSIITSNHFGNYKIGSSLTGTFDYRYCRTTARSYNYVPSESVSGESGRSQYIGCRLVLNIEK